MVEVSLFFEYFNIRALDIQKKDTVNSKWTSSNRYFLLFEY